MESINRGRSFIKSVDTGESWLCHGRKQPAIDKVCIDLFNYHYETTSNCSIHSLLYPILITYDTIITILQI